VYRKFLNARSPLRLLEKGLHGGLGPGNLGIVVGGPGVGKASFLVGVALDELLRSGRVLHVSMSHTVSHIRDHYDIVFEELAASSHLENGTEVRADIDRLSFTMTAVSAALPGARSNSVSVTLPCRLRARLTTSETPISW